MNLPRPQRRSGIALVMVMVIVLVFAGLAAVLSSMMTVETRLARNTSWDTELEWLGRSGIELAKYVLAQPNQAGQQYDGLNQIWAGGSGETNDALTGIQLTDNHLGHGTFSVRITDADRKFNINLAAIAPEMLDQGLILMGVDASEAPHIRNAIADWTDRDDDPRIGSTDTESDYYLALRPPYSAKNGPIDDLTELMMIKGVTPNMYFGSGAGGTGANMIQDQYAKSHARLTRRFNNRRDAEEPTYALGFVDLFTAISGRLVNINTATANVMQLVPDVDGSMAQAIITARAGPDGQEGNEDDMPFRSLGELANVPGMTKEYAQVFAKYFGTRSSTFEVEVDVQIDAIKRTYFGVVRRNGPNQVVLLYMYWR
jgi:type II secretory pathway component PulK